MKKAILIITLLGLCGIAIHEATKDQQKIDTKRSKRRFKIPNFSQTLLDLNKKLNNDDAQTVKKMLQDNPNLMESDKLLKTTTILNLAAEAGAFNTIKMLIEELKYDANKRDAGGENALFHIKNSHQHIEHNLDLNREDRLAYLGNEKAKFIEYLIKKGADVNARNNRGQTPLITMRLSTAELKCFLQHGADVQAKTENNVTALHFAVALFVKDNDYIETLVNAGADPFIKATGGALVNQSPYDLLMEQIALYQDELKKDNEET